jgi:IS5 family transposase
MMRRELGQEADRDPPQRLIGRIRGRIEGVFGTLKRSYGLARMRYMGLARNAAATLLTLTAWNLARAASKAA